MSLSLSDDDIHRDQNVCCWRRRSGAAVGRRSVPLARRWPIRTCAVCARQSVAALAPPLERAVAVAAARMIRAARIAACLVHAEEGGGDKDKLQCDANCEKVVLQ